jgi:chromosome segregation ATPase
MNDDYKELIEFLDKKFEGIEIDIKDFKGDFLDFKNEMTDFKNEMTDFKNEMTDFKNEMLSFEDKALKDLEDLKQEKTIGDEQDKRQKSVLQIHNNALKKNKILSDQEIAEVNKLRVF